MGREYTAGEFGTCFDETVYDLIGFTVLNVRRDLHRAVLAMTAYLLLYISVIIQQQIRGKKDLQCVLHCMSLFMKTVQAKLLHSLSDPARLFTLEQRIVIDPWRGTERGHGVCSAVELGGHRLRSVSPPVNLTDPYAQ